jgi:ParB family chromosome partitioning protein
MKNKNDEYCTPPNIIEFARWVMGGIDLDPATNYDAQKTVQAKNWFEDITDGLSKPWRGNVWLNPPYSQPLMNKFVDKAIAEIPNIKSMMILTNSSTDTRWYHKLIGYATVMILFRGRISFFLDGIKKSQNRVGQTMFLYARDGDVLFRLHSQEFGTLLLSHRPTQNPFAPKILPRLNS